MNQSNRRPQNRAPQAGARRTAQPGQPGGYRSAQTERAGSGSARPTRGAAYGTSAPRSRDIALPVIAIAGVIVIVLAFFLQKLWPNGFPLKIRQSAAQTAAITEIHSGGVRINEVMTSNRTALSAQDGSTPDWIEIINASGSPQNLYGYSLAKRSGSANVFTFPELTLQPDECVIVFADSRLRDAAGEELHAPFALSSAGDTLMLFNPAGAAIDTVNVPALRGDESYVRTGRDAWQKTLQITPGLDNTGANYTLLHTVDPNSAVIITELMASNGSALQDETGFYSDYIEITNRSGAAVDLEGWYLSDDETNVYKWRFPKVTVEPGQSLIVFASGFDRKDDPAHLHTNFSLSGEGEQVLLSDPKGRLMDRVEYGLSGKNQAWTRLADGTWSGSAAPSPGTYQ